MCGIVGYVGTRPAVDVLVRGLKRLEYRGYDSTGVAFETPRGILIEKSEGKLERVESLMGANPNADRSNSVCGIGHTRWATHGKPTTTNAHPHRAGSVVLVHNGIIENYREIKSELLKLGYKPESETDSELFGYLVLEEMKAGQSFVNSVRRAFKKIDGACSFVVMDEKHPGVIVGARNGSPLVLAKDPQGGAILASDAQPILEYTKDVYFLENGEVAIISPQGVEIQSLETGARITPAFVTLNWSVDQIDKGGYPHYMLKEIYEQPSALVDTFNSSLDRSRSEPFVLAPHKGVDLLMNAKELTLIACGTSYYSSMIGKYWLENYGEIPVNVDFASEYRYRSSVLREQSVLVGVSQSGETADTLAVLRELKKKNVPTLGLTNVRGSTISREAGGTFFTYAGPEIGVAATKSFTTQLATFLMWAGALREKHKKGSGQKLFEEMIQLPHLLKSYLEGDNGVQKKIRSIATQVQNKKGFFFIGRGPSFPIALEGALKLKEIAYIHAEGYAAGELKHGPIAMIDESMVVVVLAPKDHWREKTISNLEEVKARGATIIGVGDANDSHLKDLSHHFVALPAIENEDLSVFPLAAVVQLLSYELAVLKGTDVDQPRNLAKSVTVE